MTAASNGMKRPRRMAPPPRSSRTKRPCVRVCRLPSAPPCATNGVPTRVTSLILANRDMHQADSDGHATNEFFAQGIGWIPCDLTGGCSNKEDEAAALSYFAHDDGSYILLFYDVDNFTVDTTHFGSRTPVIAPTTFRKNYSETVQDVIQGRSWGLEWCVDRQYESKQTSDWTAHVTPDPRRREHFWMPRVRARIPAFRRG